MIKLGDYNTLKVTRMAQRPNPHAFGGKETFGVYLDGGEEGAYGEGVEEVLDEGLAAVGDAHGEPVFGFGVKHSGGSPHR